MIVDCGVPQRAGHQYHEGFVGVARYDHETDSYLPHVGWVEVEVQLDQDCGIWWSRVTQRDEHTASFDVVELLSRIRDTEAAAQADAEQDARELTEHDAARLRALDAEVSARG